MREIKPKKRIRPSMIIAGVIVVALLAMTPFIVEQIEPGQVGVVYKPSSGVQDETLSQGWHIVSPITRVTEYPIRTQTKSLDNMTLATKDGKNIVVDFTYSFSVSPDQVTEVFNKFGPIEIDEIAAGYLKQRLYDASREQISKVTVLELFGEQSGNVSTSIQTQFAEDVKKIGFIIEDVALGAPKPDAKTQEAIDARVKASQELDKRRQILRLRKQKQNDCA
ncbi:SPFH domain-containing protein [Exiguobacterium artemiae]